MAERKFADEEVIKALEWCIQNSDCADCEYREKTDKSDICPIRMDALNLINKQNAEIERLKKYNTDVAFKHYNDGKKDVVSEIFEEIRKRAYSERGFFVVNSDIDDFIAELKKKYTEETK